jgi:hypothetical protein
MEITTVERQRRTGTLNGVEWSGFLSLETEGRAGEKRMARAFEK